MHRYIYTRSLASDIYILPGLVCDFLIQFALMLIGLGATVNVAKPKPGSSVAIFGLGVVGLAVCYYSYIFVCMCVLHCSYDWK